MTDRVREFLDFYNAREYRKQRILGDKDVTDIIRPLSPNARRATMLKLSAEMEKPVIYGANDLFGFNRYIEKHCCARGLMGYWAFGNLTVDFETALKKGFSGIADDARAKYDTADEIAKEFYDGVFIVEQVCLDIVAAYKKEAERIGNTLLAKALEKVPMRGATTYYEALVAAKFVQYILRLNANTHITLGRFDQYMKPYYDYSKKNGMTVDEATELTELYFISLNFDTDIYQGVQQGDNGQSMVLGGCDKDGNDAFNELSEICLVSAEELALIDPKINLRVNKNTPLSLYERGTKLTKQGLGFPQYSNDDVVIPGLIKLGYEPEHAADYAVAACWEFVIPAYGADFPNVEVMNFPIVVERATAKHLASAPDFDAFLAEVIVELKAESERIIDLINTKTNEAEPLVSMLLRPCIEIGRGIDRYGARYNNYGIHGTGLSNAADALAAIKTVVFDEKSVTPEQLLAALNADFVGYEDLQKRLLACPKMGNNEELPDGLGDVLLSEFAKNVNNKPNNRGGICRAGSGSAMEYLWSAAKVGATADGRKAKGAYGSSFSPAITTRLNGPLSAVQSFTRHDMTEICNGGPFTIEIHDTVFRNDEGERKVAQLVKTFIDLGGHQMQINAINRDRLLDAQKHPEKYPGLIVRVWGWSGYFNELHVDYQNHVIARTEFTM